MTREEAIEILHFQTFVVDFQTGKALEMAISALRQQEHRCPCDLCNFGPPSSMRGKPCTMCPAVPKQETVTERNELTNADRIRAMSDEEIAEWVCENGTIKTPCDIICGGDCKALATFDKSSIDVCKEIVMKWLQQPAREEEA